MGDVKIPSIVTDIMDPLDLTGAKMDRRAEASRKNQDEYTRQALQKIDELQIPEEEKQKLQLEQISNVYGYSPESEEAIQLLKSARESVYAPQETLDAQYDALRSLRELGKTPLTAEERAQLEQIKRETSAQQISRENAIKQNLQERGVFGAGEELTSRLMASQNAQSQAARAGEDLATKAEQRALEAIRTGGQLGSQIGQVQFSQAMDRASAADEIAKFNAAQRADVQARNVANRNLASENVAKMRQNLEQANVDIRNKQEQYNKQLPQQTFANQVTKQGLAVGALTGASTQAAQQAAAQAQAAAAQKGALIGAGAGLLIAGNPSSPSGGTGTGQSTTMEPQTGVDASNRNPRARLA